MAIRLDFLDEGDGLARLVVDQGPHSPEIREDARKGWGSSCIKLDTLLAG